MRHVSDGELHAVLDGSLDLLEEGRGEEVRSHLARCSVCRERMQDEETVRNRAQEVLGQGVPTGLELPSFEELRERAEALQAVQSREVSQEDEKVGYRGPIRGFPLAWAATIILALGVGWMGGELWRGLPSQAGPQPAVPLSEEGTAPNPERALLDTQEGDRELQGLEKEERDQESPREDVEAPRAEQLPAAALDPASVIGTTAPQEGRGLTETGQPPRDTLRVSAPPTGAPREAARDILLADSMVSGVDPSGVGATELGRGEALALEALVVRGVVDPKMPDSATSGVSRQFEESRAEPLAEAEAERMGVNPTRDWTEGGALPDSVEGSMALPGLKVVSIEWEERIPGEKALLIRQLLSPGDTLELRYLGLLLGLEREPVGDRPAVKDVTGMIEYSRARGYANSLEASLPAGWNQVVMERGRGLLVARAPLSEANLKALLKTLR